MAGHQHSYLPAMGHDALLPLYDPFTRLMGVPRIHRTLLEQAELADGQDVLEIGCGTGELALLAARSYRSARVVGVDPDPLALQRARRKAARAGVGVRWEQASAASLPLPDGSVDRVLSSLMLHHLDDADTARALAEARRVLRPGGRLHLVDMAEHGHGPGAHLGRLLRRRAPEPERFGRAVLDLLRAAGFGAVAETGTGRLGTRYVRATA